MNGQNINLALGSSRFNAAALAGAKLMSFAQLALLTADTQKPDSIADWWYRNGLNSLWLTAIVTALLTAVFVLVAQKYLLGRLPG